MDEPLSKLDAKLRVQMRAEITKLHKRLNTTTIYVTHDQTEAMTMATRLVVMKDGVIQQVGAPKECLRKSRKCICCWLYRISCHEFLQWKNIGWEVCNWKRKHYNR